MQRIREAIGELRGSIIAGGMSKDDILDGLARIRDVVDDVSANGCDKCFARPPVDNQSHKRPDDPPITALYPDGTRMTIIGGAWD